ncbi:MAG: FecR protein [Candidatus Parcubacteria bacterium]|jgi:hypothetical protein|nr:FecR protein [Candidatus Parcubacteria bacterium]
MFAGLNASRYRAFSIIGLAALLVIGAIILWLSLVPQDEAQKNLDVINVTTLHSDVFIKEGDADFRQIGEQATTTGSSTIRTSDTGRALIESSAAHRTLVDYSSEIVLRESAGKRTKVELLTGAVWSRLAKVFDSGEYYEIKTGNAVAAVRGTSFGMWYSSGMTTLVVLEGSVAFSATDPMTGLAIPGTEVLVDAGQKAVCDEDGKITVTSLTKADYALPWVLFNDSDESPGAVPAPMPVDSPQGTPVSIPDAPSPVIPTEPPANELKISVVSPSNVDEDSDERITVKGSGFGEVAVVRVGSKDVRFEVLRDTAITFYADDISPGRYDITVIGAGGKSATLQRALTVHEVVPEDTSTQGYNQDPPRQ